jgi:hypothetical protein
MTFDLSTEEARLLERHLRRHLEEVEDELVHTDLRQMQAELAREIGALRGIEERLARAIEGSAPATKPTPM